MVGLLLEKYDKLGNKEAEIVVEVGFFQNDAIPSLRYQLFYIFDGKIEELEQIDALALKEIIKVAEKNVNGILWFDKMYDYDCEAKITEDISIRKFCCDDETDKPYFVEFPKQQECSDYDYNCNLCRCHNKCLYSL